MEKKATSFILDSIGIFLIFISILRLFFLDGYETLPQFLWLCNHIPLVIGIAILFRNSFWLTAEFSFLFAGMLLWDIDFLAYFLFKKVIFESALYIFNATGTMFFYLSTVLHLFTLPLAFTAIWLLKKPEPNAWKGSVVHALVLMPLVAYIGEGYNINFFLKPNTTLILNFALYPIALVIFYFCCFVIPTNLLIVKLLRIRKNR